MLGWSFMPWQQLVSDVANEIDPATGHRFYRTVVLSVMRQQGKGLDCRTPIPTPQGWTTMGELAVGDAVFDETGQQCRVTFASETRVLDCYRVDFSDGTHLVADGDHLWTVWDIHHHDPERWANRAAGTRPQGGWVTKPTRELVGTEQIGNRPGKRERRYRMPDVGQLECDEVDLPIDPWVFGAWLGDGHSRGAVLTSCGSDVDEMAAIVESCGVLVKGRRKDPRKNNTWTFRLVLDAEMRDGFESRCKRMGVWGNKHIPASYLRASAPQRLALLQGLMDTDGTVFVTGTRRASRRCEFSVVSEPLARGFAELARSLGIRISVRRDPAKLNGVQVNWRYRISFNTDIPVFRLSRKAKYQAEQELPLRKRSRMIEKITPVPSVPTRCIQVDSPSALFRAGEGMVPTHNTTLTLPTWVERCASWPGVSVAWTMQTGTDAREKWLEEHVPALLDSPLKSQLTVRKQNGSEHVKFSNGSIQRLMASGKSSGHGKVVDLGMIDEAMAQPDDRLHQALRPAMKTRYRDLTMPDGSVRKLPGAQLWIISTVGPAGESEWFHSWMDAGRQAVDEGTCERDRIAYFEWSAPEDADPFDPAVWWGAMPALGHTVDEETVRLELAEAMKMPDGLASFQRQGLNIRGKARRDPPIPLALWDSCVADVERSSSGLVFAVDVSPEQASASIGVCWRRPDGVPQVQLVECRPGVGWLPDRVSELRAKWGGAWLLDPRGASGSQEADWPGLLVKSVDARRSCAELEASVREGGLGHYGQPELRAALEGAVKRPSEDGGWYWARRSTTVDISPLVAVTLALGGVLAGVEEQRVPNLW